MKQPDITTGQAFLRPNPTRANLAAAAHCWTAVALLIFGLLAGPAGAENSPLLRLEPAQREATHPATISEAEIARALGSLEYRERGLLGRSRGQTVFSDEELRALAPLLSDALERAQPAEQLRFASFSRRSGALSQLFRTEAVLFVDTDQQLNLVFAGIHEFAGPDEDFFAFLALTQRDPFSIQRSLVRLDTGRADWTEHGEAALWVRHGRGIQAEATAERSHPASTPEAPGVMELDPAPSSPGAVVEAGARGSLEAQVRQRLEFLRGLYEDGLISEEEYQDQRREALQRLN